MQIFRDIIYSVSATNVVDMLIIACLVYFMLAWFRGTRSFQILATLVGIGVVYLAASWFGLIMTSVLFQYLWAAIIIVLVIVFQPEIREMLDRASPIRYLSGSQPRAVRPDIIEETVRAVAELARLKIGALIVFQRMDRLQNLVLKGKPLDMIVSAEALGMVFQKNSPLHDGAVLIRRDRIQAASCILPLSSDESLSSRYGTRHRAALGLTERSDALCLVVSEERGEVSLVDRKEITNYQKKGEFRQALERGLLPEGIGQAGSAPGMVSLLLSNWQLKVLSLVAAVFLWFLIVGPQSSEVGISVPIQYTNLPAGKEISGKWMERIDVRVRGSESSLANLKPGSVRALVDLSGVVTGLNFFRISGNNVLVPPGITIAKIRPSDLHLNIAAASVKRVKVSLTIVGTLPEGTKLLVTPASVGVRALEEDLRQVKSVVTDPVKISELIGKGKVSIPVSIQPEGIRIEGMEPQEVTVSVESRGP